MFYLVFVLCLKTGFADIVQELQNTVVIAGDDTQMKCPENPKSSPFWFLKSIKENTLISVNQSEFPNIYQTGYSLVITKATLENAGQYQCFSDLLEYYLQLIVLESHPICTVSPKENDGKILLSCNVTYGGQWVPSLEWRLNGKTLNNSKNFENDIKVSTEFSLKQESGKKLGEYSCLLFFKWESNKLKAEKGMATNVPDLKINCTLDLDRILTTNPTSLYSESTMKNKHENIIWILTGCAVVTCVVVVVIITLLLKKHPDVCKKTAEPDLLPDAAAFQNVAYIAQENRADILPVPFDAEQERPEGILQPNGVYADVMFFDKKVQNSPAWNKEGLRKEWMQPSPAFSHSSKNHLSSKNPTPRSGSPYCGIDGTEYLDINSVATIPLPQGHTPPRRPPARLPTSNFQQSTNYAAIDHTSRPPPPLPPSED